VDRVYKACWVWCWLCLFCIFVFLLGVSVCGVLVIFKARSLCGFLREGYVFGVLAGFCVSLVGFVGFSLGISMICLYLWLYWRMAGDLCVVLFDL